MQLRRKRMLLALVACLVLVIVSAVYPRLEVVKVRGNAYHSGETVARIAKVAPGDPFFWIIGARVNGLLDDPWIASARVYRYYPDKVLIDVTERIPAVTDGENVYAIDGTLLPNVTDDEKVDLIVLEGWGEPRFEEAFELIRQLEKFEPQVLSYTPAGFTIQLAGTQLFTPSIEALQANWASFSSQQGARASVYPWGVSVHD